MIKVYKAVLNTRVTLTSQSYCKEMSWLAKRWIVNQNVDRKFPVSSLLLLTDTTKLQRVNTISAHLYMLFVFLDDDVAQFLWSPEQRKKLLGSVLSSLTASPDFHLEAGALPHMEADKDIELGRCARPFAVQSLCSNGFELWLISTLLVLCAAGGE